MSLDPRNTYIPGEPVVFDIIIDNPGPWQPGDFTVRDAVNLPFAPVRVLGPIRGMIMPLYDSPYCRITGDTVSCTLRELLSGTSTFKVITDNRLTCANPQQELSATNNTAWLYYPNGVYLSDEVVVEYYDCLGVGEACSSSVDCSTGLQCVKPRECFGESGITSSPRCVHPDAVHSCDTVLP